MTPEYPISLCGICIAISIYTLLHKQTRLLSVFDVSQLQQQNIVLFECVKVESSSGGNRVCTKGSRFKYLNSDGNDYD